MASVIIVLLLISGLIKNSYEQHWSYEHPNDWAGACNTGESQSPIDLIDNIAEDVGFPPFEFRNYEAAFQATITNNGHSLMVKLRNATGLKLPRISGGGLSNEYALDHIHFHWQSEHTINGIRYPLEAHFVHYDTRYSSVPSALNFTKSLAVLGVFYKLSPDEVDEFSHLTEFINHVSNQREIPTILRGLIIPEKFLPCDKAGFYRYYGSLTTPGCNEVVVWTLFTNMMTISKSQVEKLVQLESEEGHIVHNYRQTQDLNDRRIYVKRSPTDSGNGRNDPIASILLIVALISIVLFRY